MGRRGGRTTVRARQCTACVHATRRGMPPEAVRSAQAVPCHIMQWHATACNKCCGRAGQRQGADMWSMPASRHQAGGAAMRNATNSLAAAASHREVMAREAMPWAAVSGLHSLSWSTRWTPMICGWNAVQKGATKGCLNMRGPEGQECMQSNHRSLPAHLQHVRWQTSQGGL